MWLVNFYAAKHISELNKKHMYHDLPTVTYAFIL